MTTPVVDAQRDRLPLGRAVGDVVRCVARSASLIGRRRVRQPTQHVGEVLAFGDGTHARVYRETAVDVTPEEPVALVVGFRLRWVRGWGHRVFRAESLLNTPLFIGFPGFVSKLWLVNDELGVYRGVYQWDGRERAHAYVGALWWVLALVCPRDSIRYQVIDGCTRAQLLTAGGALNGTWWRPVSPVETDESQVVPSSHPT